MSQCEMCGAFFLYSTEDEYGMPILTVRCFECGSKYGVTINHPPELEIDRITYCSSVIERSIIKLPD